MTASQKTPSRLLTPIRIGFRVAVAACQCHQTVQGVYTKTAFRPLQRFLAGLLFALGLATQPAIANPVPIQLDTPYLGLIANVAFLQDENQDLSLEQVSGSYQNQFTPLQRNLLVSGFRDTQVWLQIDTHNLSTKPLEVVMAFTTPQATTITAFDSETGQTQTTGPAVPFMKRPFHSLTAGIPMTITHGSSRHFFRVSSHEPMQIGLSLLGKKRFAQYEYREIIKIIAFVVPTLAFSLLCLVVGLLRKQDATIIISGISLAILVNEIAQAGLLSPIINIPNIDLTVRNATGLITAFFMVLLLRETLNRLPLYAKRVIALLLGAVALIAVYTLTAASVPYSPLFLVAALVINAASALALILLGKRDIQWIQLGMVGLLLHEVLTGLFLLGYFDSPTAVAFYTSALYLLAFIAFAIHPFNQSTVVSSKDSNTDPEGILVHVLGKIRTDIQQPTSGIIEMVNLLSESNLSVKQQDYLSTIRLSGVELIQKSREVDALSRLYGPAGISDPEPVLLHEMLENLVADAYQEAAFKRIELVLDIKPNVPSQVMLYRSAMDTILSSLLRNAIHFTVAGDVILTVSVDDDSRVRFRVTDTGSGIPSEQLPTLFQFQKDSKKQTSVTLPLCSRLVGKLGGQLGVSSQTNIGTTFWFSLKLQKDTRIAVEKKEAIQMLHGIKMLVADENKNNRRVVSHLAEHFGIRVDTCSNGPEIMALLQTKAQLGSYYDFLLIDQNMPQMTAQQVVSRIQDNRALREGLTVIMMHAQANTLDTQHFKTLGFDEILQKPVSSHVLYNTLIRFLPQYRADKT